MKEWIEINKKLPEQGQVVSIKTGNDTIIEQVLFSEGVFWKKRIRTNVGHTWSATHWAPIEKKKTMGNILKEKENGRESK